MSEPKWLTIARADLGLREAPGAADNPRVVAMYAEAGHPEVRHDEIAWCAAAVGAWLHRAGLKGTGTLAARDYERYGTGLTSPLLGCIGVKKRQNGAAWQGHVGLVVAADPNTIWLLAGNQGDAVSYAAFSRADFTAFRWPDVPIPGDLAALPRSLAGASTRASEA